MNQRDDYSNHERQHGFGQRTHWRDPNQQQQYRGDRDPYGARSRYRDASREPFPRDQFGHEHSSEQLFDRRPFTPTDDTHYYGTGAAGYGGPGFSGGAYAYGDGSRYQSQQLEGEFSDESAVSYERQRAPGVRRYPQGPKGYTRSDERIKEDISERLMRAHHIDCSDVSVDVRGGKVSLEGAVPSRHMKHAIEDIVDSTLGVQDIDNRVRVGTSAAQEMTSSLTPPANGAAATSPSGTKSR